MHRPPWVDPSTRPLQPLCVFQNLVQVREIVKQKKRHVYTSADRNEPILVNNLKAPVTSMIFLRILVFPNLRRLNFGCAGSLRTLAVICTQITEVGRLRNTLNMPRQSASPKLTTRMTCKLLDNTGIVFAISMRHAAEAALESSNGNSMPLSLIMQSGRGKFQLFTSTGRAARPGATATNGSTSSHLCVRHSR